MGFPYIIQGDSITVVVDKSVYTVSKTHLVFTQILNAIKADDWDRVRTLVEPKKMFVEYSKGNITIDGDVLCWKGKEMHNSLTVRMVSMLKEGFSIDPMVNFMENLMDNPSMRAVNELYGFLENNSLPITSDGHFLAYKRVKDDYTDCHTGTIDNSIGAVPEMDRNEVDDDKDRTCSNGLHFCSHSYLKSFGGARTVIVKINPRDVVSIPSDYNNAKGRACRYEVVGEVSHTPEDSVEFTKPVQNNANSVKQDYDKFGRPLSMTKNAIRKREARAAARFNKV